MASGSIAPSVHTPLVACVTPGDRVGFGVCAYALISLRGFQRSTTCRWWREGVFASPFFRLAHLQPFKHAMHSLLCVGWSVPLCLGVFRVFDGLVPLCLKMYSIFLVPGIPLIEEPPRLADFPSWGAPFLCSTSRLMLRIDILAVPRELFLRHCASLVDHPRYPQRCHCCVLLLREGPSGMLSLLCAALGKGSEWKLLYRACQMPFGWVKVGWLGCNACECVAWWGRGRALGPTWQYPPCITHVCVREPSPQSNRQRRLGATVLYRARPNHLVR